MIVKILYADNIKKSGCRKVNNLTVCSDLFPGVTGVHEAGVVDLIADIFILVEGEGTAEGDVKHDSSSPHVNVAIPVAV